MPQVEPFVRGRRQTPAPAPASPIRGRLLSYALWFVTVVLVVDALVGNKGLLETMRARREYRELADSLASLRGENDQLRESIRHLREDPATIESAARKELGLIRPGEVVFILKDIDQTPRHTTLPR
jgi:cell division protein FtsB